MQLVGSVLYGADAHVARLVASLLGGTQQPGFAYTADGRPYFSALGVVVDGVLIGGVVYHSFRPGRYGGDIEIAAAFANARWCRRAVIAKLCAYPFVQLGCARITARVARKNKRARRLIEFLIGSPTPEGIVKRGADGKQDAVLYGMTRDTCRWLKGDTHGKPATTHAA